MPPKKTLTNSNDVVSMYNGQVLVKFYEPKHTYHIAIPKGYVELPIENKTIEFPKDRKEFTHLKSITQRTKNLFWKEKLFGWGIGVSLQEFRNNLIIGQKITNDVLERAHKEATKARFKKLTQGADIGTALHNFLHELAKGKGKIPPISNDPQVKKATLSLLKWVKEEKIQFILSEMLVYNPIYDTPGTLDLISLETSKEILGIVDAKTASGLYPEHYMQIAFYRETYKLMAGTFPNRATLLWLPKQLDDDRPFKAERASINHDLDLKAFECGLFMDRWHYEYKGFE